MLLLLLVARKNCSDAQTIIDTRNSYDFSNIPSIVELHNGPRDDNAGITVSHFIDF